MSIHNHHTKANKEFFEKGCAPHKSVWAQWVRDEVVLGKIIGGKIYIDLNHFAANTDTATALVGHARQIVAEEPQYRVGG